MSRPTDAAGRPYVNLSGLHPGDIVEVDDGFTCIGKWRSRTVEADQAGALFIKCRSGRHYLEGQLGEDGAYLIGVYPIASPSPGETR